MTSSAVPPWFKLKLDGKPLSAAILPHLLSLTMDESASLLDAVTIVFSVPMTQARYDLIKALKAVPGVTYSFKCGSGGKTSKEYTGYITKVDYKLTRMSMLVITLTGVDALIRLDNARIPGAEPWPSIKAAMDKMAKDAKLDGCELVDFKPTEEPVTQAEETDLAFLAAFAKKNGFTIAVVDKKLIARGIGKASANATQKVAFEDDIVSMNVNTDIGKVFTKAQAVTYDSKTTKDVSVESGKSKLENISGGKTGADYAKKAFGERMILLPNQVNQESSRLKQETEGKLQESNMHFLNGSIELYGRPDILTGSKIEITDGYWPFKGTFLADKVVHSIMPGASFKTTVTIKSDSLPPGP